MRMVALYLENGPLQWYRWNVTNKESPLSWEEFDGRLLSFYDHSTSSDYARKLSKPK